MKQRARELVEIGTALFAKRRGFDTLWQELAEQFYPERADFTVTRSMGADLQAGLMTSRPVIMRREFANLLQAMLRPDSAEWFAAHVDDEARDTDTANRAYLEWLTGVQRRAMYDRIAGMKRATKEADHDWATFGQAVIECDVSRDRAALAYRCGHLRDHAWTEDETGTVDTMHRKWRPEARLLARMFPATVSQAVKDLVAKEPSREIACRRIVVPRDDYDLDRQRTPRARFVSLYVDEENDTLLEEVPILWFPFVVPRWVTVSGSQYAWSAATAAALGETRTLQSLVRIIMEAGEKHVDPPMIATEEAIRSDINTYAGGVTWADREYDERLGEVLRPMSRDASGFPIGLELHDRLEKVMTDAFFLNKMNLPADMGTMTAFEVRKRIEQHIREAGPLLSPAEDDYSGQLCERTFEIMQHMGAFGPPNTVPEGLRGADVRFTFTSPIRSLAEEAEAQKFVEGVKMVGEIAQIDPAQMAQVDLTKGTRGALQAIGFPAKWLAPEGAVEAAKAQMMARQKMQEGAAALGTGATVAEQAGKAAIALQQAGA